LCTYPLLFAEDSDGTFVYTNEDLGKYTHPEEKETPSPDTEETSQTKAPPSMNEPFSLEERLFPTRRATNTRARSHSAEEQKKRMWCSMGTSRRRNVERAEIDFKAAKEHYDRIEEDFSVVRVSSCKLSSAQSRLENAKQRLEMAKKELRDLENDAHRQWIPPGWLRCQFDY